MKNYEIAINDKNGARLINLSGNIKEEINIKKNFVLGKMNTDSYINIKRSGVIIDGSNAKIKIKVKGSLMGDYAVFRIMPEAKNIRIRNMDITVEAEEGINTKRMLYAIYNMAEGVCVENCRIVMKSKTQIGLCGIGNFGFKISKWDSKADNVSVKDSDIHVSCIPTNVSSECTVYGIYNSNGDSISVSDCNIYAEIDGNGELQKTISVYNGGKFARFSSNNIKARGMHSEGKVREKAHAIGFLNEGQYALISSNNIIGERGGACIGIENRSEYTKISDNKILSTHTVFGVSLKNTASSVIMESNIITGTGKNARLVEHTASYSNIEGNFMRMLISPPLSETSCGIYAIGPNVCDNIIMGNNIIRVLNCGIFADGNCGTVENNVISVYEGAVKHATSNNKTLLETFKSQEK